ncbi:hypothetical protein BC629DRAFT_642450 [Irpex lacteus]|nr:hypothetical protein BC629DRAFT_642450 [Irpex lacteus]
MMTSILRHVPRKSTQADPTRLSRFYSSVRRGSGEPLKWCKPSKIHPKFTQRSLDTFDAEPEDSSEPGSYGGYGSVSRRQSSGSINSTKSKFFWRDAPQVSPRDAPVSRSSDYAPSPSTSAPRRGIAGSVNGSGISTAFAHSPPQPPPQVTHPPVRRDSNASLASSRSGGPGSLPRSSSTLHLLLATPSPPSPLPFPSTPLRHRVRLAIPRARKRSRRTTMLRFL